jgi:hypothetical protein
MDFSIKSRGHRAALYLFDNLFISPNRFAEHLIMLQLFENGLGHCGAHIKIKGSSRF